MRLEITDLNRVYLDAGGSVEVMGRGTAWLDTGSHDSLASATDFVKVIEEGRPEDRLFGRNWIL